MRIQHNIMAMNAYRNYTNNVSAMKSNLEKLSSGYKINRAGDDAAGLAISEKMRAQITGLQQAQANAKSGINLVQTAEGALTEVHDMLNRMVKLADQSANGTYDDTTDRTQLQKEINQLLDEINRIADSANFNGIKLLDGSMNAEDIVNVGEPTFANLKAFDGYANLHSTGGPATDFEAQLHKEATGSAKTSFEFDINDKSIKADEDGNVKFMMSVMRGSGKQVAAYTEESIELNIGVGEEISASDLAAQIADQFKDSGINLNLSKDMANISADGETINRDGLDDLADSDLVINYNVRAEGSKLIFEMSDAGYKTAAACANDLAKETPTGKFTDPTTGKEITIPDDVKSGALDPFQGNFNFFVKSANEIESTQNIGATNIVMGGTSTGKQLAQTLVDVKSVIFDATSGKVNDGAGIKVGDTSYVFAASDKTASAQYGDNVKVVDIRDLVKDGEFKDVDTLSKELGGKSEGWDRAITRLTEAGKDNKMFSLEQDWAGTLALTEKADYNGDGKDGRADLTTKDGIKEQIQKFGGIRANVETIAAKGKALTLQIGDTSESFNQLKVNIADCHAAALGIAGIDISNQDSAAAAVDKIRAAINTVSDVRGTLGATQNRLDHTINNLSVMTENIQDAESTIRDVDVAEEMMAYTKNNILIQSAQAMLAQANQVPQGVLQLLQ